jgi:cytochrome c oxidase subunit 1
MATEAATGVFHPLAAEAPEPRVSERLVARLYGGTALAVIGLMGIAGLLMRLTQADWLDLSPTWFYRLLTLHGAGMITGTLVGMMGALWYVLRPSVPLGLQRMLWSWVAIAGGVGCVLVATLVGGFATGWTFLYPLAFYSAGEWESWAAALFFVGLILVGVGFMVYCVDLFAATTRTYGGLLRSLGIQFLRGRDDDPPPPSAIAAVVVAVDGLLAAAAGTTIVVAQLAETLDDGIRLDALWAKNLTYFFGHSVANLVIYLAAGVVYVLVPRYAGRPWKTTKPVVVAWLATLLFVATAYSHHLYMDFVQPRFAQYVSLTASVAASIPVAVVTAYTGLLLIWGSRYRWTLASGLLYVGFAGWVIGGLGAVIDSLIPLNFRFHNTLWVVAHFHTYMLMCVVLWLLAFVAYLLEQGAGRTANAARSQIAVAAMVTGGFGLVAIWYVSGALGVPRRYAVEPLGTDSYSQAGAVFGLLFAAGFAIVLFELASLLHDRREPLAALLATEPAPPDAARLDPEDVPLTTPAQVGVALAAGVVSIVAFSPQVTDAVLDSVRYHHLQHAGNFFLGVMVGLVLGSTPSLATRLGLRVPGVALVLAVFAPAAMMLLMVPAIYSELAGDRPLHALYHLGIAVLGLLAGFGAAGLGKAAGRLVAFLAVAMALMYAAGVTGG